MHVIYALNMFDIINMITINSSSTQWLKHAMNQSSKTRSFQQP